MGKLYRRIVTMGMISLSALLAWIYCMLEYRDELAYVGGVSLLLVGSVYMLFIFLVDLKYLKDEELHKYINQTIESLKESKEDKDPGNEELERIIKALYVQVRKINTSLASMQEENNATVRAQINMSSQSADELKETVAESVNKLAKVVVKYNQTSSESTIAAIKEIGERLGETYDQLETMALSVNATSSLIGNVTDDIADVSDKVTGISDKIGDVSDKVTEVKDNVSDVTSQMREATNNISDMSDEMSKTKDRMENVSDELQDVKSKLRKIDGVVQNSWIETHNITDTVSSIAENMGVAGAKEEEVAAEKTSVEADTKKKSVEEKTVREKNAEEKVSTDKKKVEVKAENSDIETTKESEKSEKPADDLGLFGGIGLSQSDLDALLSGVSDEAIERPEDAEPESIIEEIFKTAELEVDEPIADVIPFPTKKAESVEMAEDAMLSQEDIAALFASVDEGKAEEQAQAKVPEDAEEVKEEVASVTEAAPVVEEPADPNKMMSPDEIAALFASMGGGNNDSSKEEEPVAKEEIKEEVKEEVAEAAPVVEEPADPNKMMSPDEIAALFASMGGGNSDSSKEEEPVAKEEEKVEEVAPVIKEVAPAIEEPADPNKMMSPDEIAALFASMGGGNSEPAKEEEPVAKVEEIAPAIEEPADPNKMMSPDEIAALFASMGGENSEPAKEEELVAKEEAKEEVKEEVAEAAPVVEEPADPNKMMSPDEIAALFASMGGGNNDSSKEEEPVAKEEIKEEVKEEVAEAAPVVEEPADPNRMMTPDEIAALFASVGN